MEVGTQRSRIALHVDLNRGWSHRQRAQAVVSRVPVVIDQYVDPSIPDGFGNGLIGPTVRIMEMVHQSLGLAAPLVLAIKPNTECMHFETVSIMSSKRS